MSQANAYHGESTLEAERGHQGASKGVNWVIRGTETRPLLCECHRNGQAS